MIVFTQDKQRIYWHCRKDPVLFGYLLGDLDERLFPHCQWICVYGEKREMQELLLVYHGSSPPTLMALGIGVSLGQVVEELAGLLPEQFNLQTNSQAFVDRLRETYQLRSPSTLLRMGLADFHLPSGNDYLDAIEPLTVADAEELAEFYALAYPGGWFIADHLALGHWYCYRENDRIVGAAGVHVCSDQYHIAVIGGCAVDPGFRGHGIASAIVAHLISQIRVPEKTICLNVDSGNAGAIRVYEKLGFRTAARLIESVATLAR